MDDDVEADMRRRQELRLIRIFLEIADPRKRQNILELAERLADEAAPDAAGLAAANLSAVEGCRNDVPD